MRYIKTAVWILILSVLFASGIFSAEGIYPELLLIFSLIFCLFCESFSEKIVIFIVCGLLSNSLGGGGFVFSILFFLYSGLLFDIMFNGRVKRIFCPFAFFCIAFVYDFVNNMQISTALYFALFNAILFLILYPLLKKTYVKKKRYIF